MASYVRKPRHIAELEESTQRWSDEAWARQQLGLPANTRLPESEKARIGRYTGALRRARAEQAAVQARGEEADSAARTQRATAALNRKRIDDGGKPVTGPPEPVLDDEARRELATLRIEGQAHKGRPFNAADAEPESQDTGRMTRQLGEMLSGWQREAWDAKGNFHRLNAKWHRMQIRRFLRRLDEDQVQGLSEDDRKLLVGELRRVRGDDARLPEHAAARIYEILQGANPARMAAVRRQEMAQRQQMQQEIEQARQERMGQYLQNRVSLLEKWGVRLGEVISMAEGQEAADLRKQRDRNAEELTAAETELDRWYRAGVQGATDTGPVGGVGAPSPAPAPPPVGLPGSGPGAGGVAGALDEGLVEAGAGQPGSGTQGSGWTTREDALRSVIADHPDWTSDEQIAEAKRRFDR